MIEQELERAITRNTHEIAQALLERQVLLSIEQHSLIPGFYVATENFITIANRAIFNDMIAH